MNIFFTPATKETCSTECSFQDCSAKYFDILRGDPALTGLSSLSQDNLLTPPLGSPLRNGDLVVLQVESEQQLNTLVSNRHRLEEYRIVLIITDEMADSYKLYHQLNPRFVTSDKHNITPIVAVVSKLQNFAAQQTKRDVTPGASPQGQ